MKKKGQPIRWWGYLLVLSILFVSRIASNANPSPPQPIDATAATSADTPEQAAAMFVTSMEEWENTPMPDADRIEVKLESMLNDSNAGAISKALPQRFLRTYLGLMVQERWASVDRDAAVEWMSLQPSPTRYQIDAVVRNWITKDKIGVTNFLNNLLAGDWKDNLLASIGSDALYNHDPETAFSLIQNMNPCDEQTRLMGKAISEWSRWDPKAALDQINQLSDITLQEKLVPSLAFGYATVDPGPAADWILHSLDPGELLNRTLRGVLGTWIDQHDPIDAANWVAKLPEGSTRQSALGVVITSWTNANPQEVTKWVNNLPQGSLRNQAIDVLTKAISSLSETAQ